MTIASPPPVAAAARTAGIDALLAALDPLLATIAAHQLHTRTTFEDQAALVAALAQEFPLDHPQVRAVEALVRRGVSEGWLCDRGEPDARFSRVAKPDPRTRGMSVDIVSLAGAAVRHTHPKGELTLGFAVEGDAPRFDGQPPGWTFHGPGSTHTPEVTGGRMLLLYVLPDGAVQWHAPA